MDKDTKTELDYLLPDKAYEILKWVALIALPAVAWLVGAVGPQWGLPHCGEIVTTINAVEEEGNLVVLEMGVNISEIAKALNAIGATPRDLIAIFQAIKAAGALQGELVIL